MSKDKKNLIPIDGPKTEFERFLADTGNKRIFFSGRFGIGKTFFLQQFFDAHEDEYDAYHLSPVRYQISSNENIAELLKYDILVELLKKYPDAFTKKDASGISGWVRLFTAFIKNRDLFRNFLKSATTTGGEILSLHPDPFFQVLGKLGRPLSDLLDLDKEFQEFRKEYISGDKGVIEKFLDEAKTKTDFVSTDYVGHILRNTIAELKGSKRSVLILDDFDRIDPEHIFRILNVLSAHMEGDEENKFGFDNIIIVGDIRNIKSIFHHKYGTNTDFGGYFDKFFTVHPFLLDHKKVITEQMPTLVKQIRCDEPDLSGAIGESGYIKLFLTDVLTRSFAINALNLRQLYKPLNHNFPALKKGVYRHGSGGDFQKIFDIGIKLLIAICGDDRDEFLTLLEKISANIQDNESELRIPYRKYIGSMMEALVPQGNFQPGKEIMWGRYPFTVPPDVSSRGVSINGSPAHLTRFFYDALIEYVRSGKYIKANDWDYER